MKPVIITTTLGDVRGEVIDGVATFRSIPYGAPVDGMYRFRSPRPVSAWEGVLDSTRRPKCSIQYPGTIFDTALGEYFAGGPVTDIDIAQDIDENCLELSVLTTLSALQSDSRPVMVYLHGGGFFAGSHALATASQRFVAESEVVLVGINHRLGLLGFLPLAAVDDAFSSSANAGLQDLVVALTWVQDHIRAFGGDPTNVTIFGESGGGQKVANLLGMPAAEGLFHRAIIESAPDLTLPGAEEAADVARQVLAKLGVAEGTDAAAALQSVAAEDLLAVSLTMPNAFMPYVDGKIVRSTPFADDWTPTVPVPLIVGSCLDELTWFASASLTEENSARLLRKTLGEHAEPILQEYRGRDDSIKSGVLRALSDALFGRFVERARAAMVDVAPLYTYAFGWQTPIDDGKYRAFHTAELPLVLRHVRYAQSETLSRRLAGLWTSFARTGRPEYPEVDWPAATAGERTTLVFDAGGVTFAPDPTHQAFWAGQPGLDLAGAMAAVTGPSE